MPTVAPGEHLFMCWCTIVEHLHRPFAILLCSVCTKRGEVGWVGGAATQPTEH